MTFKSLKEPIVDKGIKNTHFFEGRLLSGKDLSEQQHADRTHRQQLGRALGHGVVEGLNVTIENTGGGQESPVVRVAKGLAITLEGDTVELAQDYVDIALSRDVHRPLTADTQFKRCSNMPTETLLPSNVGLYILVMSPASEYQQYAPKSGMQDRGVAHNCGRAYLVEGVQFHLVQFDPTKMPHVGSDTIAVLENTLLNPVNPVRLSDLKGLSMLRNLVAHICLGTVGIQDAATDPNLPDTDSTSMGLDELIGKEEGLAPCDTPLCLIYWSPDGIAYLDNWSAKRKVRYRDAGLSSISSSTRNSYLRTDEARLQYQEHLSFLQGQLTDISGFQVKDYFRYLPPLGYLPTAGGNAGIGFDIDNFFDGIVTRKTVFVEAAALTQIIQSAQAYWPIDLQSKEMIWLYRTRQNAQATDSESGATRNEYVVFTSGHAPYFGSARFNLNKWDYSNYGLI